MHAITALPTRAARLPRIGAILGAVLLIVAVVIVKRQLGLPPVAALGLPSDGRLADPEVIGAALGWVVLIAGAVAAQAARVIVRA